MEWLPIDKFGKNIMSYMLGYKLWKDIYFMSDVLQKIIILLKDMQGRSLLVFDIFIYCEDEKESKEHSCTTQEMPNVMSIKKVQ